MNFTAETFSQANIDLVRREFIASGNRLLRDPLLRAKPETTATPVSDETYVVAIAMIAIAAGGTAALSALLQGSWLSAPINLIVSALVVLFSLPAYVLAAFVLMRLLGAAVEPRAFAQIAFEELPGQFLIFQASVLAGALMEIAGSALVLPSIIVGLGVAALCLLGTRRLMIRSGVSARRAKNTLIVLLALSALSLIPALMTIRDAYAAKAFAERQRAEFEAYNKELMKQYQ